MVQRNVALIMRRILLAVLAVIGWSAQAVVYQNFATTNANPAFNSYTYQSNWSGYFPQSTIAPAFTNGVRYVNGLSGNNSGNGQTPAVNVAYSNIWFAVANNTNALIWVLAGNYTDQITNINNNVLYFDTFTTNTVNNGIIFRRNNANMYVGGNGTFIGTGNTVLLSGLGNSAATTCQFFCSLVNVAGDAIDTVLTGDIIDFGATYCTSSGGFLIDHGTAGSTINIYSTYYNSVNGITCGGCTSANATNNFFNCRIYEQAQAVWCGIYTFFGGTLDATNGLLYGAGNSVGSSTFVGTMVNSIMSVPTNSTLNAQNYNVGGYVKYPNGNNYWSATNRLIPPAAQAPVPLPNPLASPIRYYVSGKEVTLTEASATTVFNVSLAAGKSLHMRIYADVRADDGVNFQSEGDTFLVAAVNKTGTVTTAITTPGTQSSAVAVSSGTLTTTWTAVANGNSVDIKASSTSSLTQTTLVVMGWRAEIDSNDTGLTITSQ